MSSYCKCHVALLHGAMGVQCVIVVFPDHTHLLFGATSIVRLCNVLYVLCAQCTLQIVVCDMSIGSLHKQSKAILGGRACLSFDWV